MSLGKVHQYVAPFFVVDHSWARQEENNTVSFQESSEAEQHQAWNLFSRLPLISPAAAFTCQLQHFSSLICTNPLNSHLKEIFFSSVFAHGITPKISVFSRT